MNTNQVTQELNITRQRVTQLLNEGKLPNAVKVGSRWQYDPGDVAALKLLPLQDDEMGMDEAIELTGLPRDSIYRLCREGELTSRKLPGGMLAISRESVDEFCQNA
jgi:excisionase family DNA binding protein